MQYLQLKPSIKFVIAPQGGRIIKIWTWTACRDWRELLIPIFTYPMLFSSYSSNRSNQLLHKSFFLSFFLSQIKLIRHFVINESPDQSIATTMIDINMTAIQVSLLMNTQKPFHQTPPYLFSIINNFQRPSKLVPRKMTTLKIHFIRQLKILVFSPSQVRVSLDRV